MEDACSESCVVVAVIIARHTDFAFKVGSLQSQFIDRFCLPLQIFFQLFPEDISIVYVL